MSPRSGLDKEAVLLAAAELVDQEGLQALSLSRLAQRLGVRVPSLYNHVDGLPGLNHELEVLSVQRLGERLAEAVMGEAGPQALQALAAAYRQYAKESPGLYTLSQRSSSDHPDPGGELQQSRERVLRAALAVVASFGLSGQDGLHAVRGLRSLVHGFASLEISGGFGLPLDIDESFRRLVEIFIYGLQDRAQKT